MSDKIDSHVIQRLKDQLLIVLVNRLGGNIDLPIAEVDNTGQYILELQAREPGFLSLQVTKKQ